MARNSLTAEWDSEALQIPEDELPIWFFDTLRRRPAVRQRRLWIADDFQCSPFLRHSSTPEAQSLPLSKPKSN
jgi:hypothetical protein